MSRCASISIAVVLSLVIGNCGRGDKTTAVTGEVTFSESPTLPPGAVLEIMIEDASRADAPALTLASVRIENPGAPPVAYSLPYDPRRIDARNRYVVRARILVDDELWFTTDTVYPVLTQGQDNQVDVALQHIPPEDAASDAVTESVPTALGDLPASYTGDLPCADCRGIRYHLVLHADRTFFLRMVSLARGAETAIDELGTWSVSRDGSTLQLRGTREAPMQFAIVDARTLRKLDTEGRRIQSTLPHDVTRTATFATIEPHLSLRGLYTHMADAGVFRECTTGRTWPVAMEGANADLERQYLKARRQPGDEVLTSVEARVAQRPKMEGEGTQEVLVVARVIGMLPGQPCTVPPTSEGATPLEGTEWVLVQLGRETVKANAEGRRPSMTLDAQTGKVAAFGGCNQMFGSYALTGNGVRFSGVGGTLMACPDAAAEVAFGRALERVVSWRVDGAQLELADASGAPIMRFESRPAP